MQQHLKKTFVLDWIFQASLLPKFHLILFNNLTTVDAATTLDIHKPYLPRKSKCLQFTFDSYLYSCKILKNNMLHLPP